MDRDRINRPNEQNTHLLQVDLTPRQRKISSPYPLYHFKKPEDYHPTYETPSLQLQTRDQHPGYRTNYQPQTHQANYSSQPHAPTLQSQSNFPAGQTWSGDDDQVKVSGGHQASHQAEEAKRSRSQQEKVGDVSAHHGNQPAYHHVHVGNARPPSPTAVEESRPPPDHENSDLYDHPQIPGYHEDRRNSRESNLDLHQGQGSLTDDDKLNESAEKDRQLEQQKADLTADDDVERGLEILRQLHEQSEAGIRRQASADIRGDANDERTARRQEGDGYGENHAESSSATPVNSELKPYTHPDNTSQGDSTPTLHALSPVTLLPPADVEVYYSLSKRRYHVAPSLSESSWSRQLSPESSSSRAQSRHTQDLMDDPAGRYARRATRADVLHRAERLLHSRLQQTPTYGHRGSPRDSLRSSPRMSPLANGRKRNVRRKQRSQQLQRIREASGVKRQIERKFSDTTPAVRKVAFVDVDHDVTDDEEEHEKKEEHSLGRSPRETERDRAERDGTVALPSMSLGEGRREEGHEKSLSIVGHSFRQYSNSRRSSDVIIPVKRRAVKRAVRPKKPGVGANQETRVFSGSEEDVAHYGQRDYNDPARYELSRTLPPLFRQPPSLLTEGEQSGFDQGDRKARRVWFFRNGDPDFRARLVVISKKLYPNLETLLVALENIVPIVAGVKYIFSLPEGRKVRSVRELQDGCYYVCSSVNRFTDVKYGDIREQGWKGGKVTHDETHLFVVPHDLSAEDGSAQQQQHPGGERGQGGRPLVLTLVSNMQRDSQEKLILNPHTSLNYEALIGDLHNMVHVPFPPVTALYTLTRPHVKVEGFTHLFRNLKDHREFLVCGEEGVPLDPSSPSFHPPNTKVKGQRSWQRSNKLAREMRKAMTPRRGNVRRTEAVHCEIIGKRRDLFAPSQTYVDTDGKKPQQQLKLEWVYGYRGRDVRQNLVVLPNTGEVVYFVAAVIVLYDRQTHTQKHYTGHTEEVTCLALHPTSPCIASGQLNGPNPEEAAHVRVWDALTLSTHAVIGLGHFLHGVASLSFSHGDEDLLLAMEDSERHVMTVWVWNRQDVDIPCARTTTTDNPVVMGCFYPFNERILISYGQRHLYFWTIFWDDMEGKILRDKKSGILEGDVPSFITSICFTPKRDVITGDSNGSLLVWTPDQDDIFLINRHASEPMAWAHAKSVSSLVMLADGILLSGAGSEIKAWDSQRGFELLLERELPEVYGTIRQLVAITTGVDGQFLVGTSRDFILEGSLRSLFRPLVQGHSQEVWAMKAHPKESSFFTAGHDAYVIKWSSREHRPVWTTRDTTPCTSMAVDPRGVLVAVGTTSGKVTLFGTKDGKERNSFQAGQAQVNALSFAPADVSGYMHLAVGCHDGFIYLYKVREEGRVEGRKSAKAMHSSMYVMHVDWSADGRYLQTVLGDYDLVFWDVHNLMHTKAGRTMRDVKWQSFSAPVGFPLVGAWNWLDAGEAINVACRSGDQSCLLTGDSRGRLRLFSYPSIAPRPEYRQVKPFSSNTTAAEFLNDDKGVVTSGGSDAAILQYAVDHK